MGIYKLKNGEKGGTKTTKGRDGYLTEKHTKKRMSERQ